MKFKIRYADQIVGSLAIVAILALIAAIFLLGSKQRWFAKDYNFRATFDTATGFSVGMPLIYKGFTIGKIKQIDLTRDDAVDVRFYVFDTYYDRMKEGSVIELLTSPIPIIGNQFLLHPGNGTALIAEGSLIPRLDSPEGRALVAQGAVSIPKRDDTVNNMIAQINPILSNLNGTLASVNGALNGEGTGPLAETMTNISGITGDLDESLGAMLADVKGITASLEAAMANPTGPVAGLIDPDGTMFSSIEGSLDSVEGTLNNLEGASSILRTSGPQIARLLEDLRIAVEKGQDVLEALKNNPLLKGGVPERAHTDTSGTNSRNVEF